MTDQPVTTDRASANGASADRASADGARLGAWLRQARTAAGLTQEELAERSGIGVRAIGDLERGRTGKPYARSIRNLADALGVPFPGRTAGPSAGQPAGQSAGEKVSPRQLPAPVRHFVGRQAELDMLTGLLDQAGGAGGTPAPVLITAIGGMGGVGKTALAVHWAHQIADRFPDGQLYVNLRGFDPSGRPAAPAEAIRDVLDALGVPAGQIPAETAAQTGLYRSLMAGRRMLVLLDNARDAGQVRPLLPGGPGCLVVVTSRSQLTGLVAAEDAHALVLGPLTETEAADLLAARLGAERMGAESAAAAQLIGLCARLPLALAIAAARASARPALRLDAQAAELMDAQRMLDALETGDATASVRAVFSWSLASLPPASQRMFRLLGLHPGPDFSAEAAASLAGVPRKQTARLLASLVESSLLSQERGGRFALHDLLGVYAAELAGAPESAGDRRPAVGRMLDHYLITAAGARSRMDVTVLATPTPPAARGVVPEEITSTAQALAWLEREYAVLLRLTDLAAADDFDVHAWQLPRAMGQVFDWRARWDDWDHTHHLAAGAAVRLGDPRAQALVYLSWLKCAVNRKRWRRAEKFAHRAHRLFGEVGDRAGQARTLVHLGVIASSAGRYEQAIDWSRRAHAVYAELGDLDGQAGTLVNLGLHQVCLGAYDDAEKLLSQARDMFSALGHRRGEAMTVNNLGLAYQGQGDHRRAITCHQTAARAFADFGDLTNQAEALKDLADACHGDGQLGREIDACEQAAAILTELQHPNAARMQARLAELQHNQPAPAVR